MIQNRKVTTAICCFKTRRRSVQFDIIYANYFLTINLSLQGKQHSRQLIVRFLPSPEVQCSGTFPLPSRNRTAVQ